MHYLRGIDHHNTYFRLISISFRISLEIFKLLKRRSCLTNEILVENTLCITDS